MENVMLLLIVLLFSTLIGAILASKFKQPSLMGLLLIGAIIGPHMLKLIPDQEVIELCTNLGIVMIMFIVGLKLDLRLVKSIGFKALLVGLFKIGIIFFAGYYTSTLLGLGILTSVFIGLMLCFSSTVIVVKVMEDKGMLQGKEAPLLLSMLIFEDLFAILLLTLFSTMQTNAQSGIMMLLEKVILTMAVLVITYVFFTKILKFVVRILINHAGEEYIVFIGFLILILFSYLTFVLNLSFAIGAFLAGSVIASLPNSKAFETAITPYSNMATSFFFIAMGAQVDLTFITKYLNLILILLAVAFVSRFIAVGMFTYVIAQFKSEQSIFSSVLLFSVGEFSLIIAKEGMKLGSSIDLLTISSAIIFASALLMTLSVGYTKYLKSSFRPEFSRGIRNDMSSLSTCIKSIFESLDTENRFSRIIKNEIPLLVMWIFLFLTTIYGSYRLIGVLVSNHINNLWVFVAILFVGTLALVFCLFCIYYKSRVIITNLETLLLNFTMIKNQKYSGWILFYILFSLVLFLVGLYFPLYIFLNNLDSFYNYIPFVLILMGGILMGKAMKIIKHLYFKGSSNIVKKRFISQVTFKRI